MTTPSSLVRWLAEPTHDLNEPLVGLEVRPLGRRRGVGFDAASLATALVGALPDELTSNASTGLFYLAGRPLTSGEIDGLIRIATGELFRRSCALTIPRDPNRPTLRAAYAALFEEALLAEEAANAADDAARFMAGEIQGANDSTHPLDCFMRAAGQGHVISWDRRNEQGLSFEEVARLARKDAENANRLSAEMFDEHCSCERSSFRKCPLHGPVTEPEPESYNPITDFLHASLDMLGVSHRYADAVAQFLIDALSPPQTIEALARQVFERLGPGFHDRATICATTALRGPALYRVLAVLDGRILDRVTAKSPMPFRSRHGVKGAHFTAPDEWIDEPVEPNAVAVS